MILLQTSKLTKLYSGTPILENVQFEVKKGERIAVVGRNGAGKSTLLKMIADSLQRLFSNHYYISVQNFVRIDVRCEDNLSAL